MNSLRKQFLATLLIAFGGFSLGNAQAIETFKDDPIGLKKVVLPNGFTVLMIEDHTQPAVFGAIVVKAGGKNDPKEATGMAHYLEHMLFKGTQDLGTTDFGKEKAYLGKVDSLYEILGKTTDPEQRKALQTAINEQAVSAAAFAIPNEFDRLIASIGGTNLNAFTTEEMTVYHNTVPPNQLEKWCDIYSHRFQRPVFRLFQSELETVYEEKNKAMDNFGYALIRTFSKQLYKNHPYGQQDVIGETDHLKNPSLMKMYQYFNTYYVANNMALVLSGDFDSNAALEVVKSKFGILERKPVPVFPEYKEAEFQGREYMKGRYTPVKAGLAAFRTVPFGHPDEAVVDVMNEMLSNSGQTGFIDFLVLDQQLLIGQVMSMPHIDHGASLMIIVPKLIGQSVANAEEKVLDQLRRLRLGDFDEVALTTAKSKLRIDFDKQIENNFPKAMMAISSFSENRGWSEYISYPQKIQAVSKEKVMEAANKYYGENYLILESKMGFPKKEKLEKPGYKAPVPPADAKSSYAKYFDALPEGKPIARFVDLAADMQTSTLGPNAVLYRVPNPYNDLFELKLKFGMGSLSDKRLPQAARFVDVLGTSSMSEKQFKLAVAALGSQVSFEAEENFLSITVTGFDKELEGTLSLLQQLLSALYVDASKLPLLVREEKSNRKLSEKDVQEIGNAMAERAKFGEYSSYLNRLSIKELETMQADTLVAVFRKAMSHACEVHYSGRLGADVVSSALAKTVFGGGFPKNPARYIDKSSRRLNEQRVYFLDRKDALQSQVFFIKEAGEMKREELWLVDAFNEYFGGSMSALVFQEIREFRSLAYTANAPLRSPEQVGGFLRMDGFIGCQADKTIEALRVMHSLFDSMPSKPERIEGIRKAVIQSAYTERPEFRKLSQYVVNATRRGFTEDPSQYRLRFYEGLTWDALFQWYSSHIAYTTSHNPTMTVVTGDSRQIPMEELQKYGDVEVVSLEQVFRN